MPVTNIDKSTHKNTVSFTTKKLHSQGVKNRQDTELSLHILLNSKYCGKEL